MDTRRAIAEAFNDYILATHIAHSQHFDAKDIVVGSATISTTDMVLGDTDGLSHLFFENFFPQNPWVEYHHFTKMAAFEQIVATGCIYLSAVQKRFNEKEFSTFYDNHEMDGYKRRKAAGISMQEALAKDAFFWSLTCNYLDTPEEQRLWEDFAGSNGVRLVFSITDVKTDLRKIHYPDATGNIPLLKNMMGVAERYGKFLIFGGLSKVGFFYLPGTFHSENETRLLIKREQAVRHCLSIKPHPKGHDYLELPFESDLATIKLIKVIPGKTCDIDQVRRILSSQPGYEAVAIQV
jgi:hypothetical protein